MLFRSAEEPGAPRDGATPAPLPFHVRLEPATSAAGALLFVGGRLSIDEADLLRSEVTGRLPSGAGRLDLDLSELESLDGASAALLHAVCAEVRGRGFECEIVGAGREARRILELYGSPADFVCLKSAPTRVRVFDHVGAATVSFAREFLEIMAFVGDLAVSLVRSVRSPRSVNWRDVTGLMERAGADGLPIVLLINFLVGLIIALQSSIQLQRFGAEIFVADLVGLSITRELAPLMTAIVVAGRSGAAYAAELGTMKVSEEIDALRCMWLDPQRQLVFPRVLALVLVVPGLTLLADVIGMAGGLVVAMYSLDLTLENYVSGLGGAVGVGDVLGGLLKSAVFAWTIAMIACQRGLATRGGASGVGASTTSAVVTILFALIVLDAVITGVFNAVGI